MDISLRFTRIFNVDVFKQRWDEVSPMSTFETVEQPVDISVANIGGIDKTEVSFTPGITILSGRNATNRTSLLQGLMAGLGSENISIKGDADEAHVEFTIGGETYSRTLTQTDSGIYAEGEAALENTEVADLFVFLLESNEARRAVELGSDLRELIMRPVDTEAIEAEIEDLQAERDDIDRQLENLDAMRAKLPELEQRRVELNDEIEAKEAELEATTEAIDEFDSDVGAAHGENDELESALEEFRDVRSELEDIRYSIDSERESIGALESEIEELEADLSELPEMSETDLERIESQMDSLRSQRETFDAVVNDLQKVIEFNEEMLEGTSSDIMAALQNEDDEMVTDRLVDDQVVCWACGSEVGAAAIEETLERLRNLRQEKLQERRDVQSELDELKTEKATHQERRRQRSQVQTQLDQARNELEQRRGDLEELLDEQDSLENHLSDLEAKVENLQSETESDLLELHRDANEIEFELDQLRNDLDDVNADIERLNSELGNRDELEAQREGISDEIENLRTRIEQIEREAVDQFNEHMETVLDMLDYENLDRIWIEQKQQAVSQGRRNVEKSVFDLHVVRSTDDGTTYEDSVDHLSESEREVTGLIFALAGYLAHEVYEECPFLLLDSVEAIDSDRIARLIDYVSEYAEFVVAALLPEDAQALDDSCERITEI